jgi:hypothetical protein
MDSILLFENDGSGITFSNIGTLFNNYRVSTAIVMLIINLIFWLALGIYLD